MNFIEKKKSQTFCSAACANKYRAKDKRIIIKCAHCNIEFSIINNAGAKYCCWNCKKEHEKISFRGSGNPNFGNHKLKGISRTDEDVEKIRIGVNNSWKEPARIQAHLDAREKYFQLWGYYPTTSPTAREKQSKIRADQISNGTNTRTTYGKNGHYISTKTQIREFYNSSWELVSMQELDIDSTVVTWTKKHKIHINISPGHRYIPDFLITYISGIVVLEEVKGYVKDRNLFALQIRKAREYVRQSTIINEYRVNYMLHLKYGKKN